MSPFVSTPTSTTGGAVSSSMNAIRPAGSSGSSGTYAAPVFATAYNATTSAKLRSMHTATKLERPIPAARK